MVEIEGYVREAGGGTVLIVVDRDTESYPDQGRHVIIVVPAFETGGQPTNAEMSVPLDKTGFEAEQALRDRGPAFDEDYIKRRTEGDWQTLIAQVNDVTRQRDELTELLNEQSRTIPITNEPLLGLADTEALFRELICRFKLNALAYNGADPWSLPHIERAIALAEMLGGLSAPEKEYRTVDHD